MLVEVRLGQVGGAAPPLDVAVEFTAEVTVGAVASALAPGPGADDSDPQPWSNRLGRPIALLQLRGAIG